MQGPVGVPQRKYRIMYRFFTPVNLMMNTSVLPINIAECTWTQEGMIHGREEIFPLIVGSAFDFNL